MWVFLFSLFSLFLPQLFCCLSVYFLVKLTGITFLISAIWGIIYVSVIAHDICIVARQLFLPGSQDLLFKYHLPHFPLYSLKGLGPDTYCFFCYCYPSCISPPASKCRRHDKCHDFRRRKCLFNNIWAFGCRDWRIFVMPIITYSFLQYCKNTVFCVYVCARGDLVVKDESGTILQTKI